MSTVGCVTRAEQKRAHRSWQRGTVLRRDRWRCHYCSCKLSDKTMTLDHIVPKARGGGSSIRNFVASCRPCNEAKADQVRVCSCDHCEAALQLTREQLLLRWTQAA